MPTTQEIEDDKGALTRVFDALGFPKLNFTAQRLVSNPHKKDGIDDFLALRAILVDAGQPEPTIQDFHSYGANVPLEETRLCLVPSRPIGKLEADRLSDAWQQHWKEFSQDLGCQYAVTADEHVRFVYKEPNIGG